jgi:ApaG protein
MPQRSDTGQRRFVFAYRIRISNESTAWARLLSRCWSIVDANGSRNDVVGEGVVGQQPELGPGESHEYESYCPLATAWGTMEGSYTLEGADGERFEIAVGRFYLVAPGEAGSTPGPARRVFSSGRAGPEAR